MINKQKSENNEKIIDPINNKDIEALKNIIKQGNVINRNFEGKEKNLQNKHIMNILLGNTINDKIKNKIKIQKILNSHLYLLSIMENKKINENDIIHNYEEIINRKTNTKQLLNKTDLKKGNIIVREYKDEKIIFTNIRDLIESLSLEEMYIYNIGLGAASSRTEKQKQKAQKYTDETFKKIKDKGLISINSDASINNKIQKAGWGLIVVDKEQEKIIKTKTGRIDTNDAQKAEMGGILNSLKTIQEINTENEECIAIICDCKNAINYITGNNKFPEKYTIIIQSIQEQIYKINDIGIRLEWYWIPGHTDNQWNDKVDSLAKEAAHSHITDSVNTQNPLSNQALFEGTIPLDGSWWKRQLTDLRRHIYITLYKSDYHNIISIALHP